MTSIEAIINRQLRKWELEQRDHADEPEVRPAPEPIVTISRQTGSRGSYFGSRLALKLGYQRLHREAIDAVCKSSGYRRRIIESLDNRFRNGLELAVETILTGQAVDHSDYTRNLCKVVLSMSRLGGVVLMGRGGNFILGPDTGLHIRVVCPEAKRIENLMKYKGLSHDDASREIQTSDENRRHFIQKVFDADIDDPHNYDLVLNTAFIDVEELVETTVTAIHGKMDKLMYLDHDPS
ncbi:MAG: cytidylate kinase-like family protein [candidate division Zixibacteria bacterium]|nr:cytidylate kinase-like family protein [candidate division Zixibacteria bacterium]